VRTRLLVILASLALVLAAVQSGLAAPAPQPAGTASVTGQIQSYWVTGFSFGKYSLPGNFPYFNYSLVPDRTNRVRVCALATNTCTDVTGHTNSYTPFRLTGLLPGVWDIIAVSSDANGNFPGHVATHYHEVFNVRETVYIPTPTASIDVGIMVVPLTPVGPGTPVQTTDN
jgi:hypothetical protein